MSTWLQRPALASSSHSWCFPYPPLGISGSWLYYTFDPLLLTIQTTTTPQDKHFLKSLPPSLSLAARHKSVIGEGERGRGRGREKHKILKCLKHSHPAVSNGMQTFLVRASTSTELPVGIVPPQCYRHKPISQQ